MRNRSQKKAERAHLYSILKVAKAEAKITDNVWPISQLIDTFSFQHPENKNYVREHKIEFIERKYKNAIKRLSLMHLTAPFLINITQFGFQKGGYITD